MRIVYHNGEYVTFLSPNELGLLRFEMAEAEERAMSKIITHKSLTRAHKDKDKKRLHRNAKKRAETHHKRVKKLQDSLETESQKSHNYE